MTYSDVVIIGGSLNGAALAIALAGGGVSVTVIDAMALPTQLDPDFDGRSYALSLSSVRMLDVLGLWNDLSENAQPILDIKVSDGHAGQDPSPLGLHFDHTELEEGPMGYMVEDRHLRQALLRRLTSMAEVTHLTNVRVVAQSVAPGRVVATLDTGDKIAGTVLVGADGRTGPTATRAGIKRSVTPYSQTALVCALTHEIPHAGTARQYFMPSGPLAILPLKGNRSSIVWSEADDQAKKIQMLDDADYLDILKPRVGSFLGEISLDGGRYTYPLNMSLASQFYAERVALVGDAMRGVHPIAGQGLNAGLRDVAALAEVVLTAKRRGEDIGTQPVLERYAQWRRFDTATLAFATDAFNRLFSNDNPLLRAGRDLGMGLVNATPALRRTFMREAAGLSGDQPALMRGEQI